MMQNKVMPKLRFREFSGAWESKKLGDISKIIGGGTPDTSIAKYWNGDINWFTPTEIKNKYSVTSIRKITQEGLKNSSAKLLKQGTILFSSRATVGECSVLLTEACTNQGFQSFEVDSNNYNEFLYYWIINNKKSFITKASGSTFLEISKSEIEKIRLSIPSLAEQEKIANYLSAIDEKINLLSAKEKELLRYKKAMMQKLFAQEIRFKDDEGKAFAEWEEKKLGEVISHISRRNKDNSIQQVLSVSNSKGFILQDEQFENHRVASKDVSNYKIVLKGEFAYNPSRINVGSIALLESFEAGIISPMYVVFKTKKGLDARYFSNLVKLSSFNYFIKKWSSGSVRETLNFEDLAMFKYNIPSLAEQQKIADFLSAIDEKINTVQEQINHMQSFKKAMLQQMFV